MQSSLSRDWDTLRHAANGWPQFLEAVTLSGLRGWSGQAIEFRYPIVAIAGENGSGKSTILKVAASAYRSTAAAPGYRTLFPGDFFPSTPWEVIEGVALGVRVRRGDTSLSYSMRKRTRRWRGISERPDRSVYFLDISRTQPIDTLVGYARIAKMSAFSGPESRLDDLNRQRLSRIMRRTYREGRFITNSGKVVGILGTDELRYSNFHQGAGEDTTADLVLLLQDAPRHSLIVIDEVESSLHPRAQRRLMAELMDLARVKRLQFVMSTHSPYILEELPPEARIYTQISQDGSRDLIYGVTAEYAMTMMDEDDHPELDLYCEDGESAAVVSALLRKGLPDSLSRVKVLPVGSASVVQTLGRLCGAGKLRNAGLGILDGDQGEADGCVVLPGGQAPERAAFEDLNEAGWEEVAGLLGVRQADLLDARQDAMNLDNHHTWPRRTAEALGPAVRVTRVWEDVVRVWIDRCVSEDQLRQFCESIETRLDLADL